MIGGRIVFHDGKLLTLDERLLRRDAQEAASRLDAADDVALAGAKPVAKFVGMFCALRGARVTLCGGILTSFAKAGGTAFSRFRVKPALLFVAHLQNAPDNPPDRQIQAIRPKSPLTLPL
jgi:hypothetical protein